MTVSGTTYKNTYTLDESTTVFPYTFKILTDADMLVTLYNTTTDTATTLTLTTDYTVSGAGNDSGTRNVTYAGAASYGTTYRLILQSNMDYTQPTDFIDGDDYSEETVETSFDRLAIQVRQIFEFVKRCLKFDTNTTESTAIADAVGYLYSDGAGTLTFGTPSGVSDTIPAVSVAYAEYGVLVNDDGDAYRLVRIPFVDGTTFYFKNSSGDTIATLDNSGNLNIAGVIKTEVTF